MMKKQPTKQTTKQTAKQPLKTNTKQPIQTKAGIQNNVEERFLFLPQDVLEHKQNELTLEKFKIISLLGEGGFAKVYKAEKDKQLYALKEIDKSIIKENKMISNVKNEVEILYKIQHENIIKLFNHFESNQNIYLVTELASGGSLSLEKIKQIIGQLANALQYLHITHKVFHRDIKPENILLDEYQNVKLADFGWSNYLPQGKKKRMTVCGTDEYLAPEVLNRFAQSDKLDIWGIGVLIYEMFTNKTPFLPENIDQNKQLQKFSDQLDENIRNCRYKMTEQIPLDAQDLIQKCLQKDQNKRISIDEILNHPFITGQQIQSESSKILIKNLHKDQSTNDLDSTNQSTENDYSITTIMTGEKHQKKKKRLFDPIEDSTPKIEVQYPISPLINQQSEDIQKQNLNLSPQNTQQILKSPSGHHKKAIFSELKAENIVVYSPRNKKEEEKVDNKEQKLKIQKENFNDKEIFKNLSGDDTPVPDSRYSIDESGIKSVKNQQQEQDVYNQSENDKKMDHLELNLQEPMTPSILKNSPKHEGLGKDMSHKIKNIFTKIQINIYILYFS